MKPVAAGIEANGENEDVTLLREASSFAAETALINPTVFAEPIAPHIAAADKGHRRPAAHPRCARSAAGDVGGRARRRRRRPARAAGEDFNAADLAVALALPVILVVGMRLGCLNHALLTLRRCSRAADAGRLDRQSRRSADAPVSPKISRRWNAGLPAPFAGRASTAWAARKRRAISASRAPESLRSGPHGAARQPRRNFPRVHQRGFR